MRLEHTVSSTLFEYPIKKACATYVLWWKQQAENMHI